MGLSGAGWKTLLHSSQCAPSCRVTALFVLVEANACRMTVLHSRPCERPCELSMIDPCVCALRMVSCIHGACVRRPSRSHAPVHICSPRPAYGDPELHCTTSVHPAPAPCTRAAPGRPERAPGRRNRHQVATGKPYAKMNATARWIAEGWSAVLCGPSPATTWRGNPTQPA